MSVESYREALENLIDLTKGENFYKKKTEDGYLVFAKTLNQILLDYDIHFSCPHSIRLEILAQHHFRALTFEEFSFNPANGNLLGLAAFPTTLITRIVRVLLKFLVSPFALTLGAIEEKKKKLPGIVKMLVKGFGYELVDFFFTFAAVPIGIVNLYSPNAIKLDWLRNHYVNRLDHFKEFDALYNEAEKIYDAARAKLKEQQEKLELNYHAAIPVTVQHKPKLGDYQILRQESV